MGFPVGKWSSPNHDAILYLRSFFNPKTKKLDGEVTEMKQKRTWKSGAIAGKIFSLKNPQYSPRKRTLTAHFKTSKHQGWLYATLGKRGHLTLKTNAQIIGSSTFEECETVARPVLNFFAPDIAAAGQKMEVRITDAGTAKGYAQVKAVKVEIRDAAANWQWSYQLIMIGAGLSVGASAKSSASDWKPVKLKPPRWNWSGAKVVMKSAGAGAGIGYKLLVVNFFLPKQMLKIDFSSKGFLLGAELDAGSVVVGKLSKPSKGVPYFP